MKYVFTIFERVYLSLLFELFSLDVFKYVFGWPIIEQFMHLLKLASFLDFLFIQPTHANLAWRRFSLPLLLKMHFILCQQLFNKGFALEFVCQVFLLFLQLLENGFEGRRLYYLSCVILDYHFFWFLYGLDVYNWFLYSSRLYYLSCFFQRRIHHNLQRIIYYSIKLTQVPIHQFIGISLILSLHLKIFAWRHQIFFFLWWRVQMLMASFLFLSRLAFELQFHLLVIPIKREYIIKCSLLHLKIEVWSYLLHHLQALVGIHEGLAKHSWLIALLLKLELDLRDLAQ